MNVAENQAKARGTGMLRDIHEFLLPTLGISAAVILEFIIRRTVFRDQLEWGISVKEIQYGIVINGEQKTSGTGLSRATIHRCLNKLEEMELLVRGKMVVARFQKINVLSIDHDEFDNLVDRVKKKMARKRGTDRSSKMRHTGSQNDTSGVSKRYTTVGREETVGRQETVGGAERDLTLSQAIEKGEKKYRQGTQRRLNKHKKPGAPSMTAVNDYIKVIISRHELQSIAPLTQKDYGVFKKNWLASPEPYTEVLDWAIPFWDTIHQNHFDSDRKFPMIPTMRYIAYNWRRLLDAYREDMRNVTGYQKADERKSTKLRKVVDETVDRAESAEDRVEELEREAREKDQKIKELESVAGYDDPREVFRKLYHGDRRRV